VSSTLGSSIITGWKRRSSALSFSMCLRYSSRVVAPMQRSSPRARAGLSMLAASWAPSALPAPTRVWSSSMNRMILPSAALTSLSTALRRSSNSPRYLAPATRAARSSCMSLRSRRLSGTSPAAMRRAMPSAIAVLPTPGSPIRTGLFLVRRESTWMARRISSSRPITGSSFCWRAASVRSRQYLFRTSYFSSGESSWTVWVPRISASAESSSSRLPPSLLSTSAARIFCFCAFALKQARTRCSTLTKRSCSASASPAARSRSSRTSFDGLGSPPCTRGWRASSALTARSTAPPWMPVRSSSGSASPPSCCSAACRR
jgi:hypothetical protein